MYLAYIGFFPNTFSAWPSCICLNHRVALCTDFYIADEFISKEIIKCSNDKCEYSSAQGVHKKIIRQINTNKLSVYSIVKKCSQTGRSVYPSIQISFWTENNIINGRWKIGRFPVKDSDSFSYFAQLPPNYPVFIDNWKRNI